MMRIEVYAYSGDRFVARGFLLCNGCSVHSASAEMQGRMSSDPDPALTVGLALTQLSMKWRHDTAHDRHLCPECLGDEE